MLLGERKVGVMVDGDPTLEPIVIDPAEEPRKYVKAAFLQALPRAAKTIISTASGEMAHESPQHVGHMNKAAVYVIEYIMGVGQAAQKADADAQAQDMLAELRDTLDLLPETSDDER